MGIFIRDTESDLVTKISALAERTKVLASNIANANTPGYTAKEVDFSEIFSQEKMKLDLAKTHPGHISSKEKVDTQGRVLIKDTYSPVQLDEQILEITKTSMEYQGLLRLLSERFGLYKSIIQERVE